MNGYVSYGTVNLTVESRTQINFTTSMVNFSSGSVTAGSANATLDTSGAGSVSQGNWTARTGLIVQNDGNQNVSLALTSVQGTASSFLGGTNPAYQWNITNNEANSCTNASGVSLGTNWNVNSSSMICSNFSYADASDTIRIDFKVTVPSDSKTGALSDTITATATAVA